MSTRNFALVAGIAYLVIGILGFVPGIRQPPPAHAPHIGVDASYGYLFALFPVNVLHNLVHIAIGIWGLSVWKRELAARTFARGVAVIYGVLTVMGLIPGLSTVWGLVPLFGHDIWLHALTTAIAAYFGFAHRGAGEMPPRVRPTEGVATP